MSIEKPWGTFLLLSKNEKTTVKIIMIDAGHRTSLQYHKNRDEKWYIIKGIGIAELDGTHEMTIGSEMIIPKKKPHRITAITDLTLLEISYGEFEESDIIRLDDDYSR
jgi:mannose-6-phosphate isomerase-like protein (cupin superfamily)